MDQQPGIRSAARQGSGRGRLPLAGIHTYPSEGARPPAHGIQVRWQLMDTHIKGRVACT